MSRVSEQTSDAGLSSEASSFPSQRSSLSMGLDSVSFVEGGITGTLAGKKDKKLTLLIPKFKKV